MQENKLYIICHTDDDTIILEVENNEIKQIKDKSVLLESWLKNPPKPYSVRVDQGLPPKNIPHIHLFNGKTTVVAMNADGTPHDGKKGLIPNKAFDYLKKQLPNWNWPSNQIVECVQNNPRVPSFKTVAQSLLFKARIKQFYNSIKI